VSKILAHFPYFQSILNITLSAAIYFDLAAEYELSDDFIYNTGMQWRTVEGFQKMTYKFSYNLQVAFLASIASVTGC